jgi:hypothetical protein
MGLLLVDESVIGRDRLKEAVAFLKPRISTPGNEDE